MSVEDEVSRLLRQRGIEAEVDYLLAQRRAHIPPAPASKFLLYVLAVVFLSGSAWFFFKVPSVTGYYIFAYLVAAITCFYFCLKLFKAGYDADKKYAEDMKSRVEVRGAELGYERTSIEMETARALAASTTRLQLLKDHYEEQGLQLLAVRRQEEDRLHIAKLRLDQHLIERAADLGYDVATMLEIEKKRTFAQIELEARWAEYLQDQRDVTLAQMEERQQDDEITKRLLEAYELRKQLEASDDPAKDDKLRLMNQNIKFNEDLLYARQDRQLQATNGKSSPRTLPASNPPADDDSTLEEDENLR